MSEASGVEKSADFMTPVDILTSSISLADMAFKAGKYLFQESVSITDPQDGKQIQLDVGEAGNLALRASFVAPRIDIKKLWPSKRYRRSRRMSGIIVKLGGSQIYPPAAALDGKTTTMKDYMVDTKHGEYETKPTSLPVIAVGGKGFHDNRPVELTIEAFNTRVDRNGALVSKNHEESDAAKVTIHYHNPFELKSFTIDGKDASALAHAKDRDKVTLGIRILYDRKPDPAGLSNSGSITSRCAIRIARSPHMDKPRLSISPKNIASALSVVPTSTELLLVAENLSFAGSTNFELKLSYSHKGITENPVEPNTSIEILEAVVQGKTEATGWHGDTPFSAVREWVADVKAAPGISKRLAVREF